MNDNETIRNIIVKRRTELGISLSEMARKLNIPKSTLSRYENLKHQYPLNEIENFSKVLDLSPEFILGFEDEEVNHVHKNYYENRKNITIVEKTTNLMEQLDQPRQMEVLNFTEYQLQEQQKLTNFPSTSTVETLAAHSDDPNKKYSQEKIEEINRRLDEEERKHGIKKD